MSDTTELIGKAIRKLADRPWQLTSATASRIDKAIEMLADRRAVFSSRDIAVYADLEQADDAIKNAVRAYCENQTIVCVDQQNNAASCRRYLGTHVVKQWWIDLTQRLARLEDMNFLTKNQLTAAMSFAFRISPPWNAPPQSLLNIGQQSAMVAVGHKPDTFVFPWTTILRAYPQAKEYLLCSNFADEKWLSQLRELSLESVLDKALEDLDSRETEVIRSRFGINTDHLTLDKIGKQYDVTRERIRQIEGKALVRLRRHAWLGFAADFVRSRGSLLIPYPLPPYHELLVRCTDLNITDHPELKLCVIDIGCETSDQDLSIFPCDDAARINKIRKQHLYRRGTRSRPQMLYVALHSLGRAAHYEEIAQRCNQLFPEKQCSIRNWHAALARCTKDEAFGIVWIGMKGKYGLKEHGYSRPKMGLYDAVAQIVETMYAKTKNSVSFETVMRELRKQRSELNTNSVNMALSFNDRLKAAPNGYIPSDAPSDIPYSRQYDIANGFKAFVTAADGNDQQTGTSE